MNSKIKTLVVSAVVLAVIFYAGLTMLRPAQSATPLPTQATAQPAPVPELHPPAAPIATTLPPPAAAPVAPPPDLASPPAAADAMAITELKAAFADMARLYRASDLATLAQTYTPPDQLKPETIQSLRDMQPRLQTDETSQLNFEASAQAYEALAEQTPTFNAAGDAATYIFTQPPLQLPGGQTRGRARQTPITFVKINGQWYRKP